MKSRLRTGGVRIPMSFARRCSLQMHGKTQLWIHRIGGRVHRRRPRQHRLVRTERRTAPVLERSRAGDCLVVLWAAALRTDVRVLADRRQAPGRQPDDRRLRAHLVQHAQGRVLPHPGVRRLELPPRTRRPGRGGEEAESRNRRQVGGGRGDFGRTYRAGGTGGRIPDRDSPIAVGGGIPFLPNLPSWISLRLVENRTFPGGAVLLRYEAK